MWEAVKNDPDTKLLLEEVSKPQAPIASNTAPAIEKPNKEKNRIFKAQDLASFKAVVAGYHCDKKSDRTCLEDIDQTNLFDFCKSVGVSSAHDRRVRVNLDLCQTRRPQKDPAGVTTTYLLDTNNDLRYILLCKA